MKSKLSLADSRKSTPRGRGAGLLLLACLTLLFVACQPQPQAAPPSDSPESQPEATKSQIQEAVATVQTPTAGWKLELLSAHRVDEEYWCVFRLIPPAGMAAQVISEVSETARFLGPDLPSRIFVLGKTWNWESEANATFIRSLNEITDELADAEPLALIPD